MSHDKNNYVCVGGGGGGGNRRNLSIIFSRIITRLCYIDDFRNVVISIFVFFLAIFPAYILSVLLPIAT